MTQSVKNSAYRLPAMNRILDDERVVPLCDQFGRSRVRDWVRNVLSQIRAGELQQLAEEQWMTTITDWLVSRAAGERGSRLRKVINGTGVILHTNLGRAPLADSAREAIAETVGYSNLEIHLETGKRGSRTQQVEDLWCELTGAEAAVVVNNCAAATLLALRCVARGREVIISRGQLIEIGGSYRLPDVFEEADVQLKDVGTTNKTHLSDYEQAIGEQTAAILRVHPSNYRQIGFTESVPVTDLCELAHRYGLPLLDDVGSGCVVDLSPFGLGDEPTVGASLDCGADLVLFSGDKLFGGPQCGVILGHEEIVGRIRKSPLTRALRVDKITLAALEATLRIYLSGRAFEEIPVLRAISQSPDVLRNRAERLQEQLAANQLSNAIEVTSLDSTVGGGSLPGDKLPSWGVLIRSSNCTEVARKLRTAEPALLTRIWQGSICIDLRTVAENEDELIYDALLRVLGGA